MNIRQGKAEKRTSEKSAQVKPIKNGKEAAGWVEENSNLKNWRGRVNPEHNIHTTLLREKTPRVAYTDIHIYEIYRNITSGRVWEIGKRNVWNYFSIYGSSICYTSEELCIL